jgi:hypothetical protein
MLREMKEPLEQIAWAMTGFSVIPFRKIYFGEGVCVL